MVGGIIWCVDFYIFTTIRLEDLSCRQNKQINSRRVIDGSVWNWGLRNEPISVKFKKLYRRIRITARKEINWPSARRNKHITVRQERAGCILGGQLISVRTELKLGTH